MVYCIHSCMLCMPDTLCSRLQGAAQLCLAQTKCIENVLMTSLPLLLCQQSLRVLAKHGYALCTGCDGACKGCVMPDLSTSHGQSTHSNSTCSLVSFSLLMNLLTRGRSSSGSPIRYRVSSGEQPPLLTLSAPAAAMALMSISRPCTTIKE